MKAYYTSAIFLLVLMSCGSRDEKKGENFDQRAIEIIDAFDTLDIELFKNWEYTRHRGSGFWSRNDGDDEIFRWLFISTDEYSELTIVGYERFLVEYELGVSIDSTIRCISIRKDTSDTLRVTGVNDHGADIVLVGAISQEELFLNENPFKKYEELNSILNKLQLVDSNYTERVGGIIQFHISAYHILTYVPNRDELNPAFKEVWDQIFASGKWLNENWNLRKSGKQIDLG